MTELKEKDVRIEFQTEINGERLARLISRMQ